MENKKEIIKTNMKNFYVKILKYSFMIIIYYYKGVF